MAAVLKTAMGRELHRGFESHTLRQAAQTWSDLLSGLPRTVQPVTEMVVEDDEPDLSTSAPVFRPVRIEGRLAEADVEQLIALFKAGTTIREFVEHYGIGRV
jgi:hypothetical protein